MTSGLINVLKPPGMTSHDVVSFIRRTYHLKRVGHAGTLDPAASGVLPVALGSATRLLEYMTDTDKSYRVELTIGYETDTGDDTGAILNNAVCVMPVKTEIEKVLSSFIGTIEQIPPMYSAIKIQGKKLYELARAGITVERQPRIITIHNITLLHIDDTRILFDVTCSKGTYIRSLCSDIGKKINCPVVMSFLVRTRVGDFSLENSFTLQEIENNSPVALLPLDYAIGYMPKVILTPEIAQAFQYGQSIENSTHTVSKQTVLRIYDQEHSFIGIGQINTDTAVITPIKVIKLE
ncbi:MULTISPECIES: tRNA pseudouridine(55) synthase TruB [Pelosinus]|uniref:tRNA pseudouridine synthase B n=1 Tax=Pelosinus fermentans B4 TaxID=1149862 RepID=I9LDV7_9FIRM|nr:MULTISPECIES: tRNA pseudouridine(55) synthase TruB [Pelosinus]EIW18536.1 tRNA pseudouridine synthase B [Pelosinus fermentans B4]EIW24550.1 tRNA pseudouridine synthase B [Pelosinus fermentans A11]OAM94392.1 tRNA pseudouridine synthase B [Pelosinus fermentans DSM 17108]SDR07925.1 tRNA pseudouridine synthase B [Pelosinus fermentans]